VLGQAHKELAQRFDFQGTAAAIEKTPEGLVVTATTEDRVRAAIRVLVKAKEGIEIDKAREIVQLVKESKLRVQACITGKNKDDLQMAIRTSGSNCST